MRLVRGLNGINDKKILQRGDAINTLLMALLICVPALNNIFSAIVPSFSGSFMTILYVLISGGLFLSCVLRLVKVPRMKLVSLVSFVIIVLFYCVSFSVTRQEPQYFFVYFIVPFLSGSLLLHGNKVDIELLLRFIMIIPSFGVFFVNKIFLLSTYNRTITMGQSYAFLAPVLANILFLFYYCFKRRQSILNIILILFSTAASLYFLIQISLYGSRGPIVSVLLCIMFCYGFKYDQDKSKVKMAKIRFWLLLLAFAIVIIFFWDIVKMINTVVDSGTIRKMLYLHDVGNTDNNRFGLYSMGLSMFFEAPILGHGIASFEYYTGQNYPHNLVIQLLFDGGIVLLLVFLVPFLIGLFKKMKRCTYDEYVMVLFFFFSSVVKAFVSGDIWENERMWLFYGFLTSTIVAKSFFTNTSKRRSKGMQGIDQSSQNLSIN